MSNRDTENQSTNITDEVREHTTKHTLSKFEHDLYIEENDVVMPIIRVKWFGSPKGKERWKIFRDDVPIFLVDGAKLSKKGREFLRGINGTNFMIGAYKSGQTKSFSAFRAALKAQLSAIKKS
jgi:hypothetical protein